MSDSDSPNVDATTVSFAIPEALQRVVLAIPGAPQYIKWWTALLHDEPLHLFIETTLVLFILYILLKRRPKSNTDKASRLAAEVVDELVDEFTPAPLCPPLTERALMIQRSPPFVLEGHAGTHARVQGCPTEALNLVTMDFHNLGSREDFKQSARDALDKYGCGSCGPRGFYGTIDTHLHCEEDVAKFLDAEAAIIYSDATSTVASAIAAFANRADLLVIDEGVNDSILTGVKLSRSRHIMFKHNDIEGLEEVLRKVDAEDKRLKRKPQRRFIVIEGLYRNFGDVAPFFDIVQLKKRYKWRIFVDESTSFGVLGKTGRGITEHAGLPFLTMDLMVASMACSLASVGGFCAGNQEVVEHQRLNGAGYVFSASQPPFTATAASKALEIIDREGETLLEDLRSNAMHMHEQLSSLTQGTFVVESDAISPILHLRFAPEHQIPDHPLAEEAILREITAALFNQYQIMTVVSSYIDHPTKVVKGFKPPPLPQPSIRVVVNADHDKAELTEAARALALCGAAVLESLANNSQPASEASNGVGVQRAGVRTRRAAAAAAAGM